MNDQSRPTFEKILEDNKERIYRFCRIYAIDPVEPQDLFQEVIFQIWKSYDSFEGRSQVSTWVYKIALNVCYRSKKRLEKISGKVVQLEAIQFIPSTDDLSVDKEKYKALYECIEQLSDADQSIVVLYLEELPYREIANITGLTENHVAVKMKRIRKLLFDCITPKLD